MSISPKAGIQVGTITTANPVVIPYPDNVAVGDALIFYLRCLAGGATCTAADGTLSLTASNTATGTGAPNEWVWTKIAAAGDVVTGGSPSRTSSFTLDTNFTTDYISSAYDGSGGVAIGASSSVHNSGFVNAWIGDAVVAGAAGSTLIAYVVTNSGGDIVATDAAMTLATVSTNPGMQFQTGVGAGSTGTRGAAITSGFTSGVTTVMILIEPSGGGGGGIQVAAIHYVTA